MPSPTIARLDWAPGITLTLKDAAIVDEVESRFRLVKACGPRACGRYVVRPAAGWLTKGLLGTALVLGVILVSVRLRVRTAETLDHWVKRAVVAALSLFAFFYALPALISWAEQGRWWLQDRVPATTGGGTLVVLLTLLAHVRQFTGASEEKGTLSTVRGYAKSIATRLRPLLVKFVGAIVGPAVVVIIALAFGSYASQYGWRADQLMQWLWFFGPLSVVLAGFDLNEWSLHPFYRERLRSAFAVDRTDSETLDDIPEPRSDPLSDLPDAGRLRNEAHVPELLICAAGNIADDRITAPGRPVVSWTFSRRGIGSAAIGAATGQPEKIAPEALQDDPKYEHLAQTWTAVAVSGAAFSPAMGKMTRPERFLFALGNLRLGLWYPNPRYWVPKRDADTPGAINRDWYESHHPRPWYLAKEALGLHRLRDPWVYVTDGGHYENLGLVELLRVQSDEIYVFDASGDSPDTFGTLADAMRLAREEMNIEIDIDPAAMKPDDSGVSMIGVWAGTVRYPHAEGYPKREGWLVIAKLAVPATAPFDIIDLARTLPSFPNNPTADQLYTDQKFEAYRALGHHLGAEAVVAGTAIRELRQQGRSVGDAVAQVNKALCARGLAAIKPECEPPKDAEEK